MLILLGKKQVPNNIKLLYKKYEVQQIHIQLNFRLEQATLYTKRKSTELFNQLIHKAIKHNKDCGLYPHEIMTAYTIKFHISFQSNRKLYTLLKQ